MLDLAVSPCPEFQRVLNLLEPSAVDKRLSMTREPTYFNRSGIVSPSAALYGSPKLMLQEKSAPEFLSWNVLKQNYIENEVTFSGSALSEKIGKILLTRKVYGEPPDCS